MQLIILDNINLKIQGTKSKFKNVQIQKKLKIETCLQRQSNTWGYFMRVSQ